MDTDTSARVPAAAAWIADQRWAGVRDVVPALASVAVHLAPECDDAGEVSVCLPSIWRGGLRPSDAEGPVIEIAGLYGGADGPDLAAVAEAVRLDCRTRWSDGTVR